jgi:2-(1,2-epoxy-1,2-dihydrophenyl)acetyl-CoA isomerase
MTTVTTSTVTLSRRGRVAMIELNRPETRNAIDQTMRRELLATLDAVAHDVGLLAVILTGAGPAFSSGFDMKRSAAAPDADRRRVAHALLHDYQPILECMTRMDKPLIAAVNGPAIGIGVALVLACDLVLMAEDAYLLAPFVGLGIIPDGAVTWFLTRRIGYARAFEVLAQCRKLDAARCFELGLANRQAAPESLRNEAWAWAGELARQAPLALALTKRIARLSASLPLSEALTIESELQNFLFGTEDVKEAVQAFAAKRPPEFRGR